MGRTTDILSQKKAEVKSEAVDFSSSLRILTATSLFDGHDASIHIMRRILQSKGVEVIHIGHNRSADEIVSAAIEEDVHAIAITSYQGGHMEFFTYILDLLKGSNSAHIRVFVGGGGTILPHEISTLHKKGVTHVYSPDDGRKMGLEGMILHLIGHCESPLAPFSWNKSLKEGLLRQDRVIVSRLITMAESMPSDFASILPELTSLADSHKVPVVGITGTGGAGKSSLTDELLYRYLYSTPKSEKKVAILSIDPSRRKTQGALLGDRIRMNSVSSSRVYMRSMATRRMDRSLSEHVSQALLVLKAAGFPLIFLESAGVGQADTEILGYAGVTMYVMTPEYGAPTQLEKINMLDYADIVALNKSDYKGSLDALRDVKKQYQRNHQLFEKEVDTMPVYLTRASQFNDKGVHDLYKGLMSCLSDRYGRDGLEGDSGDSGDFHIGYSDCIIPTSSIRYLFDIASTVRRYNARAKEACRLAQEWYALEKSLAVVSDEKEEVKAALRRHIGLRKEALSDEERALLEGYEKQRASYRAARYAYEVRGRVIEGDNYGLSLSGSKIFKIAGPRYESWGDVLYFLLQENFPGFFPYTSGIYPYASKEEDPIRMFAGEGCAERTNRRFHYVSKGLPFARLSTAFDSVTLYGEDPDKRQDIYGKVGNAGVSIATVLDMKKLYSGFNLCDKHTSVSMTINGPAATICAFFMNTAIDQQCELHLVEKMGKEALVSRVEGMYKEKDLPVPTYFGTLPEQGEKYKGLGLTLLGVSGSDLLSKEEYGRIKSETLSRVRGTVQADILKEDQAQNTCIFSTDFSLRFMGDMQAYFISHHIRNFYSVSVSGYHIAEAGANPITQLAFTMANGFTYVEYYLSRGMKIDDFAHNLSFFFSNGMDPEYAVIGRVARRLWSKAMRYRYQASSRSQRFKYHIQTSGRSLHAQEVDFNDIRTTLQALYAIYDRCNSLHTNAYDEAITTPTEESVRRAQAIQLIINKELGSAKIENFMQGSFAMEVLTDLVEEAVLAEFERISERGGVLSAMETLYQRSKIQEESMHYEKLKNSGEHPIIGVNTFFSKEGSPIQIPDEVIRATEEEKQHQIRSLHLFQAYHRAHSGDALRRLQEVAMKGENLFVSLMETVKSCSLGQITHSLYEVGGRYRRNM